MTKKIDEEKMAKLKKYTVLGKVINDYAFVEIFELELYHDILDIKIHEYYLRFNGEYKIQISKDCFKFLKSVGIKEIKI